MILDTSFIVALRYDEDARRLAREYEADGIPQRVPAVTIAELFAGVGQGDQSNESARKYEELLANLPVVPTTGNIARRAGVIAGIHEASDRKPTIGLVDATIAATGLVYNEAVVTDDTTDFGSVEGLSVVTWE